MNIWPELVDARLVVVWQSIGTHQALAVCEDRTAWYWALSTAGEGSDVIGTFRSDVPSDAWESVVALAAALPSLGGTPVPGELGVTVTGSGVERWVQLGTDDATRIGEVVLPLIAVARRTPVSAARMETHVLAAPTGQVIAGFTFSSIGDHDVTLRLDPAAFALVTRDGDRRELSPPHLGLVDPDGTLRDGIYEPARIPPATRAACSMPLTEPAAADATGEARGALTLLGPWATPPMIPFASSSAVRTAAP